jgi:hypothetical protein
VAAAFARLCQSWHGQIAVIKHQSRTFATLRDPAVAGLPKLLRGELSGPCVELLK